MPKRAEESNPISDVNRDWTFLLQGGLMGAQKFFVWGGRQRVAVNISGQLRVGGALSDEYYANKSRTRWDVIPSVDTYYLPNEDQEHFARIEFHSAMETSQAFTGVLSSQFQLTDTLGARFSLTREVVQDSLASAIGENTIAGRVGQVRSDLVNAQALWMPTPDFDVRAHASTGIFEGLETPDNFTWATTVGAGYTIRADNVKIRVGIDATANSFDKDASGQFDVVNPTGVIAGGYFSPQLYLLEQARLDVDWQVSPAAKLHLGGGAGPQNYRSATEEFSDTQFALDVETRFDWKLADDVSVFAFYEYHDVGAAIRQHRFGFGVRVIF